MLLENSDEVSECKCEERIGPLLAGAPGKYFFLVIFAGVADTVSDSLSRTRQLKTINRQVKGTFVDTQLTRKQKTHRCCWRNH